MQLLFFSAKPEKLALVSCTQSYLCQWQHAVAPHPELSVGTSLLLSSFGCCIRGKRSAFAGARSRQQYGDVERVPFVFVTPCLVPKIAAACEQDRRKADLECQRWACWHGLMSAGNWRIGLYYGALPLEYVTQLGDIL